MGKFDKDFFLTHGRLMLKLGIAAAILICALFSLLHRGSDNEGFLLSKSEENVQQASVEASLTEREKETKSAESERKSIFVDVDGAVYLPGLYELESESRVNDAITAAGGVLDEADLRYINRAELLSDGYKLYIPFEGESVYIENEPSVAGNINTGGQSKPGLININTAGSAELQRLNGVGPATAEKIIAYRNQNGAFSKPEDIKRVSGIGEKTYEKFKDSICV